jgi:hypothetical protein
MPPRNQYPKPIDEILIAMGTIHKKLDELKKEINELKLIINETNTKDTSYSRGWFWS